MWRGVGIWGARAGKYPIFVFSNELERLGAHFLAQNYDRAKS